MNWSSSSKKYHYPLFQLMSTAAVISTRATSYHTSTAAFAMSSSILESPSAERNKMPIYDQVLSSKIFPRIVDDAKNNNKDTAKILELAAGCGVHTTHFVSEYLSTNKDLGMEWHPSDPDEEARASIDARVIQAELEKRDIEILSSGFERIPQVTKKLSPEQIADVEKLLEKIEEDDDVQNVYHTMEELVE